MLRSRGLASRRFPLDSERVVSPRIWQWPNILALDAVLAAVLWQAFFAAGTAPGYAWSEAAVLGLSVWLTYTADRLLDVSRRPPDSLISVRHRFAQGHSRALRLSWAAVLGADVGLAFLFLEAWQLQRGGLLLLGCLGYTFLHQALFPRFFPKEVFVAPIFASGVWIFLDTPRPGLAWLSFALLCLLNCLLIARKERAVDRSLDVKSCGSVCGRVTIAGIGAIALLLTMALPEPDRAAILSAILALLLLSAFSRPIGVELYRVLADAILAGAPLVHLFLRS